MQYKSLLLTIFVALIFRSTAHAGPGSSGGGDAIRCNDGLTYALDYVLTDGSGTVDARLEHLPSSEHILKVIVESLRNKIPALSRSLDDFSKFPEQPSSSSKRLWLTRKNPLIYLNDQNIDQVPVNCLDQNHNPNIWQAVIRTAGEGTFILYQRDPNALAELAKNSSIQVSFMYIHEWLRDYTTNPVVIRNVNRYLHSAGTLAASAEELRAVLNGFGLHLEGIQTSGEITQGLKNKRAFESRLTSLLNGCDSIGNAGQKLVCLNNHLETITHELASSSGDGKVAVWARAMNIMTQKIDTARASR